MLFLTKGDKLNKVAMHPCIDNFKFSWLMTVPLLDWGTKFVGYYPTIIAVLEMTGFEPVLHLLKYPQLSFQFTQHHIPKLPNSYHRWHSISTKYNWIWTNNSPYWVFYPSWNRTYFKLKTMYLKNNFIFLLFIKSNKTFWRTYKFVFWNFYASSRK